MKKQAKCFPDLLGVRQASALVSQVFTYQEISYIYISTFK